MQSSTGSETRSERPKVPVRRRLRCLRRSTRKTARCYNQFLPGNLQKEVEDFASESPPLSRLQIDEGAARRDPSRLIGGFSLCLLLVAAPRDRRRLSPRRFEAHGSRKRSSDCRPTRGLAAPAASASFGTFPHAATSKLTEAMRARAPSSSKPSVRHGLAESRVLTRR